MTVDHIDLNLIRVLDALLQDGSVSGAARRLHLSGSTRLSGESGFGSSVGEGGGAR